MRLDSYKAKMHVYLAQSSKEMHINPDMFGLPNTKPYEGMQSFIVMMMW